MGALSKHFSRNVIRCFSLILYAAQECTIAQLLYYAFCLMSMFISVYKCIFWKMGRGWICRTGKWRTKLQGWKRCFLCIGFRSINIKVPHFLALRFGPSFSWSCIFSQPQKCTGTHNNHFIIVFTNLQLPV